MALFLFRQRARTGATDVTPNDLVIGRDSRSCCNTRKSAQAIDEVMMFSRAVSEVEVAEIMAGVASVELDGLLTTTWGGLKKRF